METSNFNLISGIGVEPLNEILAHLNSSLDAIDPDERFRKTTDALNKLWNSAFRGNLIEINNQSDQNSNPSSKKTSDGDKFRGLIGLLSKEKSSEILARSKEFSELVKLEPRVMDMSVFEKADYHPSNIGNELKKEATKKHTSLFNGYNKYMKSECSLDCLLDRLANLIYVIRSNVDHGEKTPWGPDIEKSTRDRTVCEKAFPVTEKLLEIFLNEPNKYLATYGTLQDNEIIQKYSKGAKQLSGEWTVEGHVEKANGLLYFNWISNGKKLNVTIYEISEESYKRLDEYEGKGYKRIYVPAFNDGGKVALVATIYKKNGQ